jgi:hypothetical protein
MFHESLILSQRLNSVSEGAENLYYRLYLKTDDYGQFYASPDIIKGQCLTRRNINIEKIKKRLKELFDIGLIYLYFYENEIYIEIFNFEPHQTFRADYNRKNLFSDPEKKKQYLKTFVTDPNEIDRSQTGGDLIQYVRESYSTRERESEEGDTKTIIVVTRDDMRLTLLLAEEILKNNPNNKIANEILKDPEKASKWGDNIRLMRERDNRDPKEIEIVILWSQKDSFWKDNILSTSKLRKQFDKLIMQARKDNFKGVDSWIKNKGKK